MSFYGKQPESNDSPEWTKRDTRGCLLLSGIVAAIIFTAWLIYQIF